MTTDTTALLHIRDAAALVLHRAGYLPHQIASHLGATTTVADPASLTPQLLTAAAQYLRNSGFTYWGIPEAITKLQAELVPQPHPQPADDEAWDRGLLFDLTTT